MAYLKQLANGTLEFFVEEAILPSVPYLIGLLLLPPFLSMSLVITFTGNLIISGAVFGFCALILGFFLFSGINFSTIYNTYVVFRDTIFPLVKLILSTKSQMENQF